MAGADATGGAGRPSLRVMSWIHEVINPLLDILATERSLLDSGNVSWRYGTRTLEHVRAIERHLAPNSRHILGDFRRVQETVNGLIADHDEAVERLASAAGGAFDELLASTDFTETVRRYLREHEQTRGTAAYPGGAVPAAELPALFAQYVVNRIEVVPLHYTTQGFWTQYGAELVALGRGPAFDAMNEARSELLKAGDALSRWLDDTRFTLCEEYDVPAAPLSGSLG